ncbi:MAG TPA: hypothetical protein VHV10_19875 [Ktedonobacteraceae bacterium]|jgi:hypothetical protein|nr:hypothetical protein [Ktedonobacteraceae bacterium]
MDTRITIDQLERMKTHEVADLLSNVVLLLRRMPNVECHQFTNDDTPITNSQPTEKVVEQPPTPTPPTPVDRKGKKPTKLKKIADDLSIETVSEQVPAKTTWTVADLEGKKTVTQLKKIADDLHLPYPSNIKKDDLLNKLTTKLSRSHSEQYEIQNI